MSQAAPANVLDAAAQPGRSHADWLRSDYLIALISVLMLGVFVVLSTLDVTPPAAVPSSAPLTEFSSGRAMRHLGVIAQKPHPPGTAEHSVVRDYIVKEVAAMGIEPEVQKTDLSAARGSLVFGSVVENIVAKIPGTRNGGKSVLLSAHYDSVPHSTGASDDGAGVAALLETMRALRAGPPTANDIIFLFTDAEEIGLLGAMAFSEKYPAAKDVGVALNFDPLGRSGATIMYDATEKNGWLIGELAKAAPKPVVNSLARTIYGRLPYVTDLQFIAKDGVQGLNFAYLDGAYVHHSHLDSLETIDERSVQHIGSYALALARHFGNLNLQPAPTRDAIFFSVLGSFLIHYPMNWSIPLSIAVTALFAAVVILGLKKKRLTFGGMILGVVAFVFSVGVSAFIVSGVQKVLRILPNDGLYLGNPDAYNSSLYYLGFIAGAIAVISTLYIWFTRKTSVENLTVGAMFSWVILMIFTSVAFPGGSYLFTWPLLFVLIAQGVSFVVVKAQTDRLKLSVGLCLATFPVIALMVPMIYFCFLVFSSQMSPRVTAIMLVIAMLPIGLLISQLDFMLKPRKWLLPVIALLIAIGFVSVAKFTSRFDHDRQMKSSLFYALNANTGRAIWASLARRPDEWTSQFLSGPTERISALDYAGQDLSVLSHDAPAMPAPGPEMKVISDSTSNGIRSLSLHVTSARHAPCVIVSLDEEVKVRSFAINGKRYDEPTDEWRLRYFAVPPEGIDVSLELEQFPNLVVRVTDYSPGLPDVPGVSIKPRPNHLMPATELFSDGFVVNRSFPL